MEVSATRAPALAADPVSSSANQGKAMNTIDEAIKLVALEISTKTYGAMRRLVPT
jgi:hypothetical protein